MQCGRRYLRKFDVQALFLCLSVKGETFFVSVFQERLVTVDPLVDAVAFAAVANFFSLTLESAWHW